VSPSPAGQREQEDHPLGRIIRLPAGLDPFVHSWERGFHWNQFSSFRFLVLTLACLWGRRHVAHLGRDLEAPSHRTRVHHFCSSEPCDPAAALRQQAREVRRALHPQRGNPARGASVGRRRRHGASTWAR
jgi:hypothetical protein